MSTRNYVPRADGEGTIGTSTKRWLTGYFENLVSTNIYGNTFSNTGYFENLVSTNIYGNTFSNIEKIRSTTVVVGQIAQFGSVKGYYLECVTAGTTSSSTITVTETAGTLVTDNSAKWIVCDMRDSTPVGRIISMDTILRTGYVKANGATVNRADYPRLYTFANVHSQFYDDGTKVFTGTATSGATSITSISTTDIATLSMLSLPITISGTGIASGTKITAISTTSVTINTATTAAISAGTISYGNITNFPAMYGIGDGSTTMVLPSVVGRKAQPTDNIVAGGRIDAGLPNITGAITTVDNGICYHGTAGGSGALSSLNTVSNVDASSTALQSQTQGIVFNASNSNSIYGNSTTVQDPAYATIPQIKY